MSAQWIHVPDGYAAMIFKVQAEAAATMREQIDNGDVSAPD